MNSHLTVYTKPNCPMCKATRTYLEKHNIPYTEAQLETNPQIIKTAKQQHILTAPIVTITTPDGNIQDIWGGFNPTKLKTLQHPTQNLGDVAQESRQAAHQFTTGIHAAEPNQER